MKLVVEKNAFRRHPELKVIFIYAKGIKNQARLQESIHLLQETEKLVRLTFNKDTIKTHHLISPWAVAREDLGKEARHYQTSAEKLLRKVLAGKSVAARDTVTNLVRYLSLKHIIPAGVDDADKVHSPLTFAVAADAQKRERSRNKPARKWKAKKTAPAAKPPEHSFLPGEIYYRDARGILGTKLDYWKSSRTKLSGKSDSALLHFEFLPPVSGARCREIVDEAQRLLRDFCGGSSVAVALSKGRNAGIINQ